MSCFTSKEYHSTAGYELFHKYRVPLNCRLGAVLQVKSTTQLQARGCFTLILGYELCSLLKNICECEMQNSNKSDVPFLEFMSRCNVE
jgi:hypothetical protein